MRLGREREGLGRRDLDGDPRARPQPVTRLGVAVGHLDLPGRDQGLEARAREIGRAHLEEAVEPGPGRPRPRRRSSGARRRRRASPGSGVGGGPSRDIVPPERQLGGQE